MQKVLKKNLEKEYSDLGHGRQATIQIHDMVCVVDQPNMLVGGGRF